VRPEQLLAKTGYTLPEGVQQLPVFADVAVVSVQAAAQLLKVPVEQATIICSKACEDVAKRICGDLGCSYIALPRQIMKNAYVWALVHEGRIVFSDMPG
jgi:hypothetical protein